MKPQSLKTKSFLTSTKVMTVLAVGLGVPWASAATVVSVNFDLPGSTGPIDSATQLGVVPSANWNNVDTSATSAPAGSLAPSNPGNPASITVASGISLAYAGTGESWNTPNTGDAAVYGDFIRLGANVLTINGVVGEYDLIIYAQDWGNNNPMSVTVNGVTRSGTNTTTNPSIAVDGYIENNNYFLWENLTGTASVTLEDNRQLAGLQIIAIPEPSAILLGSLAGGLALLRRRRMS